MTVMVMGSTTRLEVLPGASHDEVAHAYRRLAHDAHPDAHPGDPDAPRRFREITEAFEVLGNPARRALYDRARDQARVATDRGLSGTPPGARWRRGLHRPLPRLARRPAARPFSSALGQLLRQGQRSLSARSTSNRPGQDRPRRLHQKT